MLKQLIVVWLVVAAALAVTAALVPSVQIDGGAVALLGVALLFGFVNALIGPLLRLVSQPLTAVTLGLSGLVVNGALLGIAAGMTDTLDVGGILATMFAAIVISAVTAVLLLFAAPVLQPQPEQV